MIETDTLILRRWQASDLKPFFKMSNDPKVMAYFPNTLTLDECASLMDWGNNHIDQHGFGFWVLEIKGVTSFAGFVGLANLNFDVPFAPCVEVGWRLASDCHGFGYATKAASVALDYGFDECGIDDAVSFTVWNNKPSIAVMERLGMRHDANEDFNHPKIEKDHPLSRHVLYRLTRAQWSNRYQV